MSNSLRMELTGADDFIQRLEKASEAIQIQTQAEITGGAKDIAEEAKQRAPGNFGILKNLISATPAEKSQNGYDAEVISAAGHSAYLEFGTGQYVDIPEGLEDFAAQFKGDFASGTYGPGSNLTAKEAIFAWCKAKGIAKELWYPIYVSIIIHGIHAQPFFFPAAKRIFPIIKDRIQKIIDKL